MRDDVYGIGWGVQFEYADGLYEIEEKQFAVLSTAYGDGCYGASGMDLMFPVDAGNIGMVDIGLVGKFEIGDNIPFGIVMTFDSDIEFTYDNGMISVVSGDFGMRIDTADDDDDYDWEEDDAEDLL